MGNKILINSAKNLFFILAFLLFLFPLGVMGDDDEDDDDEDDGDTIYVDISTTGSETGSEDNPFKEIEDALEEADSGDTVEILAGVYAENITIPEGVTVEGEERDSVFIVADSKYDPAVSMKDDSILSSLTVMGGKYGVYVKSESGATITGCVIAYNEEHGIKVKKSDLSDENAVTIEENIILQNEKSGIYVQRRLVYIYNNSIYENERDGVYLQGEVAADVEFNTIKHNEKSGVDIMVDSSVIYIGNNTFKGNEESGVSVHARFWRGSALIKDSKFYHNDEYGIEKIQYGNPNWYIWDYDFVLGEGNLFVDNKKGEISDIKIKG